MSRTDSNTSIKTSIEINPEQQQMLIRNLSAELEKHYESSVKIVETHISTLFLCADKAYKLKKPLDFGFLDFTTLKQRKFYCQEELRLNQRLAPEIYLRVISVLGSPEKPVIFDDQSLQNKTLQPIDYMVEMQRFEDGCLFNELLADNRLGKHHIESLAIQIAEFHSAIGFTNEKAPGSTVKNTIDAAIQNFEQITPIIDNNMSDYCAMLEKLRIWTQAQNKQLSPYITERDQQGYIRECHGDIHLGNITLHQGKVTIFDSIEFNEAFRWIDVISEIAFTVMDLDVNNHPDYSNLLLNTYLERTGDYQGLQLLNYFLVYRAMVRAKIAAFRLEQLEDAERIDAQKIISQYLALAEKYTQKSKPKLVITYGLSGSGKSYGSRLLLEKQSYIRIRSDVERKRHFPNAADRYSKQASVKTYQQLHQLAGLLLDWGFSVIIDATYLQSSFRTQAHQVARDKGTEFHILELENNIEILEKRIIDRQQKNTDASEATIEVLHQQAKSSEPLTVDEQLYAITLDSLLQATKDGL